MGFGGGARGGEGEGGGGEEEGEEEERKRLTLHCWVHFNSLFLLLLNGYDLLKIGKWVGDLMESEKEIVKVVLMFEEGALKWREAGREICRRNIDSLWIR